MIAPCVIHLNPCIESIMTRRPNNTYTLSSTPYFTSIQSKSHASTHRVAAEVRVLGRQQHRRGHVLFLLFGVVKLVCVCVWVTMSATIHSWANSGKGEAAGVCADACGSDDPRCNGTVAIDAAAGRRGFPASHTPRPLSTKSHAKTAKTPIR